MTTSHLPSLYWHEIDFRKVDLAELKCQPLIQCLCLLCFRSHFDIIIASCFSFGDGCCVGWVAVVVVAAGAVVESSSVIKLSFVVTRLLTLEYA
ncbi:hypothetical protein Tco_0571223 [Tanacetum coccineum]